MVSVSVIIRSSGRLGALAATLASIRLQTYKDYEIIVVEDGQATLGEFVAKYGDLPLYYQPLLERKGRSAASNLGLATAKGNYCAIMEEGDEWYGDHLELMMARVKETHCRVVYSWSEERTVARNAAGAITRTSRWRRWRRENFSLLYLISGEFMPTCAVLFHRPLYEKSGGFDNELHSHQDWMFWLRLAAIEPDWQCVAQATAICHRPFSKTREGTKNADWQAKIDSLLSTLPLTWPMLTLTREMKRHFSATLFLRRWYYFLSSYIR